MIADVRGYTRYTQEQGDEAAGRLAAAFAELTRETIIASGGEVIELRGDEALCVFSSARQAVRAAVQLQLRFRRQTDEGPAFQLPIGVGLDAGEAVPIEGGYRGGALNTAARLCSLAGPGQILATDTVVSLARRVEGIRFVPRRAVRLKGLESPVRVIEVVPEAGLPPLPHIARAKPTRVNRRTIILAVVVALALLGLLVGLLVNRTQGRQFLSRLDPNAIGVIDADAAGIAAQVASSSAPSAITVGAGFVWVASEADGSVSRIDPETRAMRTLSLGNRAAGVSYGGGSLWVTESDARVVAQIQPETLSVVQTFPVGNAPGSIAADARTVWVANTFDGTLTRISIGRGVVTGTIPIGARPAGVAVDASAVWVADEANGAVLRIEPKSGRVVHATPVGNGPSSIAVGSGSVWVANRQDDTVSRIDPATNRVSDVIPVGASPVSLAVGSGSVWVASEADGTLARIDAESGEVKTTVVLESSPHALALVGDDPWVATFPSPATHRGGVLRVESDPSECRCVDPAFMSDIANITDQNVFALVYDSLVAYRRTGGIAGGLLVGDLATAVPSPTDQGRTYSFQLRSDLRYSNGRLVRASDFRSSLERLLTVNRDVAVSFYGGIVGASACTARPPDRCDLSSGIEVDDAAGSITIHLAEPDPEFVHKLAIPLASVVPPGAPLRPSSSRAPPGTGPYRVASFAPTRAIKLVRNPVFRVWSQDARPDGYPDVIRFHLSDDHVARVSSVEKARADWTEVIASALPAGRVGGLLTRHADRLHSDPSPLTFWYFLNTQVPPFDDVRVRRALNYGLDRTAIERAGRSALYRPLACQILPAGFPGYRPYCPYTRNPNAAGTWSAPDLTRAHALVRASGTRGMRVEVVGFRVPGGGNERGARVFTTALRRLGYRSSLRLLPDFGPYLEYVADSRNRAQLGQTGWLANTLAPSEFMRLFSCAEFVPKSSRANANFSEFCDPRIDAKMKRAAILQASEPARANELWAEVDHALLDRAVAVPVVGGRILAFVSDRVGNFQNHPLWGTLLDQLWVN
jgi:YVTN family beta-propeller protein